MESVANTTTSIGNRDTLPEGFLNRIAYAFNRIVIKLKEFIIRTVDQIKSFFSGAPTIKERSVQTTDSVMNELNKTKISLNNISQKIVGYNYLCVHEFLPAIAKIKVCERPVMEKILEASLTDGQCREIQKLCVQFEQALHKCIDHRQKLNHKLFENDDAELNSAKSTGQATIEAFNAINANPLLSQWFKEKNNFQSYFETEQRLNADFQKAKTQTTQNQ